MSGLRESYDKGRCDDRRRSRSPRRHGSGRRYSAGDDGESHARRHRSPLTRKTRSPRDHHRHHHHHQHRHDDDDDDDDRKKDRHRSHHRRRQKDDDDDDAVQQKLHTPEQLPFGARRLHKGDFAAFRPLFAYFLSVQKSIELDDLEEREARGRWRSFVGRWNRGEHAEGWYDPDLFSRIAEETGGTSIPTLSREDRVLPRAVSEGDSRDSHGDGLSRKQEGEEEGEDEEEADDGDDDDDDDDYGPALPTSASGSTRHVGPGIPSVQDLSLRNELLEEERKQAKHDSVTALRAARKADRAEQKERLEELVPRADPGSRERKLEKRQAVNAKMREFRDKSPGMEAGDDGEVMGGGDSIDDHKKRKEAEQRRKSERQVRREEFERARREEIEAKRKAWQEREEGTMSMLRDLAKQRFG